MKKFSKKIFIFVICFVLLLIPFGNCFAIVAEASAGALWTIAQSAGVTMASSGMTVDSQEWIDFSNDFWDDFESESDYDDSWFYINAVNGSISVDASVYNHALDVLAEKWGVDSSTYKPPVLNRSVMHFVSYSAPYGFISYQNGVPVGVIGTSTSSTVTGLGQVLLRCYLPELHSGDVLYFPYVAGFSATSPYAYINVNYLKSSNNQIITTINSWNAEKTWTVIGNITGAYLECSITAQRTTSDPTWSQLGTVYFNNPEALAGIKINNAVASGSISAVFSVTPADIDIDGVTSVVQGASAILSRKVQNAQDKYVSLTPILPSGDKPLVGVEPLDVNSLLEEGFFDSVHDVVEVAVSDGSITDIPDEEETNFLPWFMPLFEHLSETVDNLYTAISEFFSNQGSGTPVFPDEPPDFLGGGDGGIRFHVSGIWHYVVSFVQSLGGAFSLFGSVWSGLPSAMFAAVYAAAVVVIVVGLFKRYIG